MSEHGLTIIDRNVQVTNEWLNEIAAQTGGSKQQAYHVLRGGLHVLRDRMTTEQSAHLSAQLPHLIRGIFFEGWKPAATPTKERSREDFLERLSTELPDGVAPEAAATALFVTLKLHCDRGELAHVEQGLPGPLAEMMAAA